MGKDDQFDNFSCINLQSCHLSCVMLCTVVELHGEG